ncbi:MAG: efflux RND transporter periplasmic adaptor subunit [Planctomycetia bacterium]|nr:efflux RND transporter periplasmic adaptor subunit [Planctomycetia bacterium]
MIRFRAIAEFAPKRQTDVIEPDMAQLAPDVDQQTHPAPRSKGAQHWNTVQFVLALLITGAFVGYLMLAPSSKQSSGTSVGPRPNDVVRSVGPYLVYVQPGHVVEKKLHVSEAQASRITVPMAKVTGTVVASLRPGRDKGPTEWQFNAPDVLTNFTEWQKARHDIEFNEKRLATVHKLVDAKVKYLKALEERAIAAGAKGAVPERAVRSAVMDTLQAQLEGEKDVYDAETALWLAQRAESSATLQLEQSGIETDLLVSATPDVDIVMADVPVGIQSRVKVGQSCEARFFGISGQVFTGKVNGIVQVMSKERRSLRVLFVIHDPDDQLRPGMFAEIGLGTDARDALLVPIEGVVHVGRDDFVLVATSEPGVWRVTDIQTGEPRGHEVEILHGLTAGDRVLGEGAILLKPLIVRSLQLAASETEPKVTP